MLHPAAVRRRISWSLSSRTNSSAYSGLPPARREIACCTSVGSAAVPSRLEISRAVSAAVSARRFTRATLRAEAAHPSARS